MPLNEKHKSDEEGNIRNSYGSSIFKDDENKVETKKTNFKTSLTVVVDDGSQDSNRKHKETPSRSDYSLLLSGLYAMVLIFIGLLFPLSEALHDNWLQTEFVTAYLVYLYVVSTVFLIFVQCHIWYTAYSGHHQTKDESGGHHSAQGHQSLGQNNHNNTTTPRGNALAVGSPTHGPDAVDASKARRSRAKHRSVTAMVRYSSSVNLNSKETEGDFASSNGNYHGMETQASQDTDFPQDDFGEVVGEEFDMWIDMSKLGTIFSHAGSSFYLRIGALFFGIGHLIYISLELENSSHIAPGCSVNKFWWTYIIRLIFIVVQTFFLFKNQSVHIHKMKVLARFGFAHLIATNFCIWLRTLINEIMQEYHHLTDASHGTTVNASDPIAHLTASPAAPVHHMATHHSLVRRATADECAYYRGILQNAAIYLFPFVLEYSLIAMGMITIIYYSIDEEIKDDMVRGLANFFKVQSIDLSEVEKADHAEGEGHHHESVFSKSHTGMFAGIVLLAACIVSIILFFYTMDSLLDLEGSEMIFLTSDIILHSIMLVATAAAIVRVHRLSYIAKPVSIDDMLLYLSMSGTLILEIAITISSGNAISANDGTVNRSNEILRLCSSMVAAIQTIAQVIVVLSGMRRYPSKASHLSDMPGRGFITFLVVANVSVWIFRTLQAKELMLQDTQRNFYGDIAWLLLMNINLPLLLFYRFHSSICLADVWMVAYEPLHQKVSKPALPETQSNAQFEPPADARLNSIIRSASVPQLYRPASVKKTGSGIENPAATFELDGISDVSEGPSLTGAYRF